jgi:dipeptidase D
MDMVCEKTPDAVHDFNRDPIRLSRSDEWLTAEGTILGADNGIALALAMAVSEDPSIHHGPLDLLFTVDEESGLTGADRLDPAIVRGRVLLNLDSEDEGVFTIGCAGGEEFRIRYDVQRTALPESSRPWNLRIGGLRGGHSGVDVHKPRENANRLLIRILDAVTAIDGVRLVELTGGSAHNAIPRDAGARLLCGAASEDAFRAAVHRCRDMLRSESLDIEPGLIVELENAGEAAADRPIEPESARRLLNMLNALPHGVSRMSTAVEGLVETSNNLAVIRTEGESVLVTTSQRSSAPSRLEELSARIRAVAALAGASVTTVNRYPAWQPEADSDLLDTCRRIYRGLFEREPVVEVIHAGLECGIIGARLPGMKMISFGPTIRHPHSPEESLHLPSVGRVYDFLAHLLADLAGMD